jgi:hypothetical protein
MGKTYAKTAYFSYSIEDATPADSGKDSLRWSFAMTPLDPVAAGLKTEAMTFKGERPGLLYMNAEAPDAILSRISRVRNTRQVFFPRHFRTDHDAKDIEVVDALLSGETVLVAEERIRFALNTNLGSLVVWIHDTGRVEISEVQARIHQAKRDDVILFTEFDIYHAEDLGIEYQAVAKDTPHDELVELFWEEINPLYEDPYLNSHDGALESDPISFESGSNIELENAVQDLILAWATTGTEIDEVQVCFRSTEEESDEGLDLDNCQGLDQAPKTLLKAFQAAFQENRFSGYEVEYNDGAHNRRSGYYKSPQTVFVTVEITVESAHERIVLHEHVNAKAKNWLQARGFTAEEIAEIAH